MNEHARPAEFHAVPTGRMGNSAPACESATRTNWPPPAPTRTPTIAKPAPRARPGAVSVAARPFAARAALETAAVAPSQPKSALEAEADSTRKRSIPMTRPIFAAVFAAALLVATQAPAAGAPDWAPRLVKSAEESAAAAAQSAETAAKAAALIGALIPDWARRVDEAGGRVEARFDDPAAYAAEAVHSRAETAAEAAEGAARSAAHAARMAATDDFDAANLSFSVHGAAFDAGRAATLAKDAMHWFTEALAAAF